MSKHNVRGTASGEYECSCGARWDRDEGGECPLGRIDGKQVTRQNETMENARVAALNGTLPEPKEVVSAGNERAAFEATVRKHHQGDMRHLEARTDNGYYVHHIQELWLIWQARAALKAQPSGVVLPPSPYMPDTEPASMTDYERGEAQGRCDMWVEVKRLNPSTASAPNHTEKQAKDAPYMSDDADPRETWAQGYNAALSADTRIVPVKLLRSLLTDVESGMMCNPDPAQLQQLRTLLDA